MHIKHYMVVQKIPVVLNSMTKNVLQICSLAERENFDSTRVHLRIVKNRDLYTYIRTILQEKKMHNTEIIVLLFKKIRFMYFPINVL